MNSSGPETGPNGRMRPKLVSAKNEDGERRYSVPSWTRTIDLEPPGNPRVRSFALWSQANLKLLPNRVSVP